MLTSAMADRGLSTHALDLEYSRKLNLLSGFGFIVAVASASWMQQCSFEISLICVSMPLSSHTLLSDPTTCTTWTGMDGTTLFELVFHAPCLNHACA